MSLRLKRYVVSQFGKPHGPVGQLVGWVMRRRHSNIWRNLWTIDLMALAPGNRVLEIGYGPGFALEQVCQRLDTGKAFGLDHSDTMARMAARRNRTHIDAGKLQLFTGSVENGALETAPELGGPFDRIYAVNVVKFWADPVLVLGKLADRLAEKGRILLTLQPRSGDLSEESVMTVAGEIADQLKTAGFKEITTEALKDITPMAICVSGRKSRRNLSTQGEKAPRDR